MTVYICSVVSFLLSVESFAVFLGQDISKCPLKEEQEATETDEEIQLQNRKVTRRPSLAESIQHMTKSMSK